jgi:ferrous iron transport protein A
MDHLSARHRRVPARPLRGPATGFAADARLAPLTLDRAAIGVRHIIAAVAAPMGDSDRARMLEEIGFIPGEQVVLMARAAPGGDPMVVRVGLSTFALRRAEAACVELRPVP